MTELRLETKLDHMDIVVEELETKLKRIKSLRKEIQASLNERGEALKEFNKKYQA